MSLDGHLDALITALPKVELHVHLEGSIVPELALRLAERHGVALPGAERGIEGLREAYRFESFRDFLEVYIALSKTLQQAEDYCEAIVGIARGLAAQQVRWVEMTFTPMTHVVQGVDPDAMLAGLAEGRRRAREEHGVEFSWIFDIVRSVPDQAAPTLELALKGREQGVIALGLAGPEGPQWSVAPVAEVFVRAKAQGLMSVPHAGEQYGEPSLRETLDLIAPDRIGHGVRCLESPAIVAELVERRIPLEVCPTSNVGLGVFASLADHPLPKLMEAGIAVSVNSDDPPLFGTTLNEEYRRCVTEIGLSREQLLGLARAAVEHSFMPQARKQELLAEQAQVIAEHG